MIVSRRNCCVSTIKNLVTSVGCGTSFTVCAEISLLRARMLSGFFHAAFNYLNGNVEGGSGRGVRCSTAEEEEKNTAMSSTESNRQNFLHDTMQDRQRLKSNQANQVSM